MKKFKTYIIPIVALILFVAIMTTGGLLKRPFSEKDDVLGYIQSLKKDVANEKWEQAEKNLNGLKKSWKAVEKRVQFSVERDEMIEIDIAIARIEGALAARDKSSAFIELSEIMEHWNSLEK